MELANERNGDFSVNLAHFIFLHTLFPSGHIHFHVKILAYVALNCHIRVLEYDNYDLQFYILYFRELNAQNPLKTLKLLV